MNFQLRTFQGRKSYITYGALLILAQPAFTFAHYIWNETVRPYPSSADSLAIPIVGEIVLWLVLAPLATLTIMRVARKYRGNVLIFQKNTLSRRFLGLNFIFGLLICYTLSQLIDVFTAANLPMLVNVLLSVYLILATRTIVIANRQTS